jgi:hypothetical protein
MKHLLIAGLLAAIGAVALVGPAHAAGKYCISHPDDPDCYDQGGNTDNGYPQPPQRHHSHDNGQNDQGDQGDDGYDQGDNGYDQGGDGYNQGGDGFNPRHRPGDRLVSRCAAIGQSLRRYGYRHIRPLDCGGSNFKYEAFRGYQRFIVKMKSSNGRILYEIQG